MGQIPFFDSNPYYTCVSAVPPDYLKASHSVPPKSSKTEFYSVYLFYFFKYRIKKTVGQGGTAVGQGWDNSKTYCFQGFQPLFSILSHLSHHFSVLSFFCCLHFCHIFGSFSWPSFLPIISCSQIGSS